MTILTCLLLLLAQSGHTAARYTQPVLSDEGHALTFSDGSTTVDAPIAFTEQEAFKDPQISPDGRIIGWLALTPNCCTSYPLPTALVLFREGRITKVFKEAPPIWRWAFLDNGRKVAYAMHPPHGRYVVLYTLRRVRDGKVIASFSCDQDDKAQMAGSGIPDWVRAVELYCPGKP